MLDAKVIALSSLCVVVVVSGLAGWISEGTAAGISSEDLTVAKYCEGVIGTDQEDECGLCQQWLDNGVTLNTELYCPDEDEPAFSVLDLVSMDQTSAESFRGLCHDYASMQLAYAARGDERVPVGATPATGGRRRFLAERHAEEDPYSRIARKLASAKPVERKLVVNYGWCSIDIGFLTGGDDTANYCSANTGHSPTGGSGKQLDGLNACCEQHDNCLQCGRSAFCGDANCAGDKGWCDAKLASCAAKRIADCSGCTGCTGCGWGGCSGCSGCSGCNSLGESAAATCVAAAMSFKPNGGKNCGGGCRSSDGTTPVGKCRNGNSFRTWHHGGHAHADNCGNNFN